jgi:LmbE family N-acetylglucosaminyl deacetylase
LPDGNLGGIGFDRYGNESLAHLWSGAISAIATVDNASQYSKQELIDVVAQLIGEFEPSVVRTLDITTEFGFDHSDHRTSAMFVDEARRAYTKPHAFMTFRGYSITKEPPNLSASEQQDKWMSFSAMPSTTARSAAPLAMPVLRKAATSTTARGSIRLRPV